MPVHRKRLPVEVLYPETDDMGENLLHRLITELLRQLIARLLAERGVVANTGANQFIYWVEGVPTKRVAPDVYVLPGVSPSLTFPAWKTWDTGIVPNFVLEVASEAYSKDYEDNPAIYGELGVEELIIFDPRARPGSRSRRVRWQVYRRLPKHGWVRVEVSQSDRVRARTLKAWLRAIGEGDDLRLRIGLTPHGDHLYPTGEEAAEAEVTRLRTLLEASKRRTKGR